MVRIWGFAVITAVVLISSFGCGQQGAGNAPSDSAEQTTSPRESSRPPTTTTTEVETTTPSGLVCPSANIDARVLDAARGAKGEKRNPVEIARREFSKKIREGDAVEMAGRTRGQHAVATVHVIREGRIVAVIEYRRAGGGWLQEYYEACANF